MARRPLPAGVEGRLKAQAEIWHRLAARAELEKHPARSRPFVTISREYGCMAYRLGERLADKLNGQHPDMHFAVYDREALEVLVEDEAVRHDVINSLSERTRGVIEDWVRQLIPDTRPESRVYRHLAETLCSIATTGEAIIIGRGGAAITRQLSGGVHVRLVAPMEWRVENLRRYQERAGEASREFVKQADREREQFVRKYVGVDPTDPTLYHLVLNNQLLDVDDQVAAIAALIRQKVAVPRPVLFSV